MSFRTFVFLIKVMLLPELVGDVPLIGKVRVKYVIGVSFETEKEVEQIDDSWDVNENKDIASSQ